MLAAGYIQQYSFDALPHTNSRVNLYVCVSSVTKHETTNEVSESRMSAFSLYILCLCCIRARAQSWENTITNHKRRQPSQNMNLVSKQIQTQNMCNIQAGMIYWHFPPRAARTFWLWFKQSTIGGEFLSDLVNLKQWYIRMRLFYRNKNL